LEKIRIEDKFRRHNVKKDVFKISFENHDVEIDMKTGKGEIVSFVNANHQSNDEITKTSNFDLLF
jgi:hypothetical protein